MTCLLLDNDANITTYEGMLELFDKVDRLVGHV
jgi:hypothetical protein